MNPVSNLGYGFVLGLSTVQVYVTPSDLSSEVLGPVNASVFILKDWRIAGYEPSDGYTVIWAECVEQLLVLGQRGTAYCNNG